MISFREVLLEDIKRILNWRTSERVAKFMVSDVLYNLKNQKEWFLKSFNKPNYYHWIINHIINRLNIGIRVHLILITVE